MSTPATTAGDHKASSTQTSPLEWAKAKAQPYLVPYYLTVVGVLGAITVGFVVITALLILVVANFNILGLIE